MTGQLSSTILPVETQEHPVGRGYLWLTRGIALLLLFAAGMKAWQLATVPSFGEGLLHARWFNIFVVEFEIAFASWLLMGLMPKLTRLATIALFSTFAVVSLYKALSGEASCGCFGTVQVNPWWTMVLDLAIAGMIVLLGDQLKNTNHCKYSQKTWSDICGEITVINTKTMQSRLCFYLFLNVLLSIVTFNVISQVRYVQITDVGQLLDNSGIVELQPKTWQGNYCPLIEYSSLKSDFRQGKWLVMLRRDGCMECKSLWFSILQIARQKEFPLAVLRLSDETTKNINQEEKASGLNIIFGEMARDYIWFAETPVMLELRDGIVIRVWDKDEIKQWSKQIQADHDLTKLQFPRT